MASTVSPTKDQRPAWKQAVLLTIPRATNTREDYITRKHMGRGSNRTSNKNKIDQRRKIEVARKRKLSSKRCRAIRTIRHCKARARCARRLEKDRIV